MEALREYIIRFNLWIGIIQILRTNTPLNKNTGSILFILSFYLKSKSRTFPTILFNLSSFEIAHLEETLNRSIMVYNPF